MLITESVCNVVWRRNPKTKRPEFIVFDYQWKDPETKKLGPPELRFPAGMIRHGEDTEHASIRKLREETGLIARETERVGKKPAGPFHTKYAFLVNFDDCRGYLRRRVLKSGGDVMSPPEWRTLPRLTTKLAPTHRWACGAAVRKLRRMGIN